MSTSNRLRSLVRLGQSVWFDDLRRDWLRDGTLSQFIVDDGVTGVTSNPTIIAQAIATSRAFDDDIRCMAGLGLGPEMVYEALVLDDARVAADSLRGVFDRTQGRDGYVSVEVSPRHAHDEIATIGAAQRLWTTLHRPNVMIKVPATDAGLVAVRRLLAAGIHVNVTLLFGLKRYRDVVEAFLAGMEERRAAGYAIEELASVASFFVSRIDTAVDQQLDLAATVTTGALRGRAAIAVARLAAVEYRNWMRSARWQTLAQRGARPQRLLWASTTVKDPAYPATRYLDALAGAGTITTVARATLEAYRDQGRPASRLGHALPEARAQCEALRLLGIDPDRLAVRLEREGIERFSASFDEAVTTIARRMRPTD